MADFVHLHVHSLYSLLDGAIKLNIQEKRNLFGTIKAKGMDTVALTDHGNMFGVVEFRKNALASGVRPIYGSEVYVAGDSGRFDRSRREAYHLVLLAKNREGYANLSYLVSMGHVEGFYYEPRIDMDLLARHSKGLVGMSACLGGQINQRLLSGDRDGALGWARTYRDVFEPDSFFIELQRTGLEEQEKVIPDLLQIARDAGVRLVASNDCHYLDREDAKAHDVLMCMQTNKTYDDPGRLRHDTADYYVRSPDEMKALFADVPEAAANSCLVADMCRVDLDFGKALPPSFPIPGGGDKNAYFEKLTREGFERRKAARGLFADEEMYRERLDFEIATIREMDYASYFLIVWDFISFARGKGIPVGPGRGSGAGSLVAYSLGITDLDPIKNGLIFERFLNPERISMPDIDTDFCERRRDEVIAYVKEKYGERNVCQIVTFSQLNAKSIMKDVCRVLGVPFDSINRLTRTIPASIPVDDKQVKVTIDMALKLQPELQSMAEGDPKFAMVIDIARTLEGLNRQTGVHAAGVVIADRPLWDLVPVCADKERGRGKKKGGEKTADAADPGSRLNLLTQFDMQDAEEAGLVKFDFLGLTTLTVIDNTLRLMRRDGIEVDISEIPLDDRKVYALLSAGDTDGVFQMESGGFKDMLRRLKPTRFEEIVAANALYRPGPLGAGLVDDYIERKNRRKPITYPHPGTEEFLKETYGVIVYQEQVMRLAVSLSKFTLGGSDKIRKAMGKKDAAEMAKISADFIDGAINGSGMARESAVKLWEQVERFAGYAFNKSHSAAYALVGYQTAWLKVHHAVYFMAALLSSVAADSEKVVQYIRSARKAGIEVLPPDVNASDEDFTVSEGRIRFGLLAIKGLGNAVCDEILAARAAGGAYKSLFDLCSRVDQRKVPRKALDLLIKSGAFDFTGRPRASLSAGMEAAFEAAGSARRSKNSGQSSLFGEMLDDEVRLPEIAEWPEKDRLIAERDALGFYVSGHPMDRYGPEIRKYAPQTIAEILAFKGQKEVTVGGVVVRFEMKAVKSGQGSMGIAAVEDLSAQTEVVISPQALEGRVDVLRGFEPLCMRCFLSPEADEEGEEDSGEGGRKFRRSRLRVLKIHSLAELRETAITRVTVGATMGELAGEGLQRLRRIIKAHPGRCSVFLEIFNGETGMKTVIAAGDELRASPDESLASDLSGEFPSASVQFA